MRRLPMENGPAVRSTELSGLIVRTGIWIAAAGLAAQSAADAVGFIWFDGTARQLNADVEFTIWAWASSTATACAALAATLLALAHRTLRKTHLFLAAALAFFSADEILVIHENLRELGGSQEALRIVWPIAYSPLLAAVFLLLWRWAAPSFEPATRSVRSGALMLAAAVGCEVLAFGMVKVGLDRGTFAYELEVIVEEGLELAAWIIVASGLMAEFVDSITRPPR